MQRNLMVYADRDGSVIETCDAGCSAGEASADTPGGLLPLAASQRRAKNCEAASGCYPKTARIEPGRYQL